VAFEAVLLEEALRVGFLGGGKGDAEEQDGKLEESELHAP
jgi:hypothetical protein